jgi:hypothetical protein
LNFSLLLDDAQLTEGDLFYLHAYAQNPSSASIRGDVYIILEAYGEYYFYPSWASSDEGIDYYEENFAPGSEANRVIIEFIWPRASGSHQGLGFYGAVFFHGSWNFAGDLNYIEWGYEGAEIP